MIDFNELHALAKRYRTDGREYERHGGYVLIEDRAAYGWKKFLDQPEREKPGALAVDEGGNVWQAVGGDDYNGARRWVPITQIGVFAIH